MANETEVERLVVRIVGDANSLLSSLKASTAGVTNFAREAESLDGDGRRGGRRSGALIARGVEIIVDKFRELGRESLAAFERHQDTTVRLTAMVTANKCAVESTLRSYEEFSDQVSRNTTAGKCRSRACCRSPRATA